MELLGGHVQEDPDDRVLGGELGVLTEEFSNTKVEEHGGVVLSDHGVLWLEISVDNIGHVGGMKSFGDGCAQRATGRSSRGCLPGTWMPGSGRRHVPSEWPRGRLGAAWAIDADDVPIHDFAACANLHAYPLKGVLGPWAPGTEDLERHEFLVVVV